MEKYEKEFLINLFEKWRNDSLDAVEKHSNDEHLRTYYTGHAAAYFEVIHYLKFKHDKKGQNV